MDTDLTWSNRDPKDCTVQLVMLRENKNAYKIKNGRDLQRERWDHY